MFLKLYQSHGMQPLSCACAGGSPWTCFPVAAVPAALLGHFGKALRAVPGPCASLVWHLAAVWTQPWITAQSCFGKLLPVASLLMETGNDHRVFLCWSEGQLWAPQHCCFTLPRPGSFSYVAGRRTPQFLSPPEWDRPDVGSASVVSVPGLTLCPRNNILLATFFCCMLIPNALLVRSGVAELSQDVLVVFWE